jgi:BMFP domain-containing protein YqiC
MEVRMSTTNPLLDGLSKLMTDAMGVAQGVRKEADTMVRSQVEKLLRDVDVVTREEFEAVKEMAANARDENDRLAARIADLEKKLSARKSAED